jgi:hypothetical protein
VPEALRPMFYCGELYKVTLGTSGGRGAEKRLAIPIGKFEKKLATFRETLKTKMKARCRPTRRRRWLSGRTGASFQTGSTSRS